LKAGGPRYDYGKAIPLGSWRRWQPREDTWKEEREEEEEEGREEGGRGRGGGVWRIKWRNRRRRRGSLGVGLAVRLRQGD